MVSRGKGAMMGMLYLLWLFCWSSGLQHTLNTTFMLLVEQRPPILRWMSSLDEVAKNQTENSIKYIPDTINVS